MPKAKSTVLLGLVESEDEDSSEILASAGQAKNNMPPARKGRPAAAYKGTKTAQTTTRGKAAASDATDGRKALTEKTTNSQPPPAQGRGKKRPAADDEGGNMTQDESMVEAEVKPKATRGRPRATKAAKLSSTSEGPSTLEGPPQPAAQPPKRGRKPKAQVATPPTETEIPESQHPLATVSAEPDYEIPETQQVETFDASDGSIDDEQIEHLPSYNRAAISSVHRMQPHYMAPSSALRGQPLVPMSTSRMGHPVVPFSTGRLPMAVSDSEASDPTLRRRIGELTRKYDNLEVKYRDLRDIGVKEAELNYDRLKKQGEERANTANQLIETLKAQLAAQIELAKEGQRLRQQLEASENTVADLQDKVTDTNKSLSNAKTEIKTLSTRLATSRAAEAAHVKVPGSAMKGNTADKRLIANAEAVVQSAQLKEDLYADLTGLIVRGIKREKDDEVYDCLQTGRNGTLHFKLSLTPDDSSEDLDEAQFLYLPQLDASRDSDLLEVLPDYLTEEITFPRTHAAKFYSRVMKFLTEKLE